MRAAKGGASEPPNRRLPGKAGGTVAVRRTLASTICRIADPMQVPRPRQLRDVSAVMRFQPAHQSMINRRFNDRASCPARKSPKQALVRKPRIHSPASGRGRHESGSSGCVSDECVGTVMELIIVTLSGSGREEVHLTHHIHGLAAPAAYPSVVSARTPPTVPQALKPVPLQPQPLPSPP